MRLLHQCTRFQSRICIWRAALLCASEPDGARLNLRSMDLPVLDAKLRDAESLLSASMTVGTAIEIEQLFHEMSSAGAVFYQQLKTEPWGSRNFIVKDPDGDLLLF